MFWMKHIMHFRLWLLVILIPSAGFSQGMHEVFGKREIDIDTSLANHCTAWKLKTSSLFGNGPRKISFGPFKTIEKQISKATDKNREKENNGFRKTVSNAESHTANFIILFNNTDSIFINLSYRGKEEVNERTIVGELLFGDNNNNNTHTDYSVTYKNITIQLSNDTTLWDFIPSYIDSTEKNIRNYYGKLVSVQDTITIQYAIGLKGMKKIFANEKTGLLFIKENKQIAAYQFGSVGNEKLWLSSEASIKIQMLTGGFIATLISTRDN